MMARVPELDTLCKATRQQRGLDPINPKGVLLGLDPGHTTGWCVFRGIELQGVGEVSTNDMFNATVNLAELIKEWSPHVMIVEDYRVYKWRKDHHVGSQMMTTRVIGCIETLAVQHGIEVFKQAAHIAKGFCTDPKLRAWELYQSGERHANDAVRHAVYFLLFGPLKIKDRPRGTVG